MGRLCQLHRGMMRGGSGSQTQLLDWGQTGYGGCQEHLGRGEVNSWDGFNRIQLRLGVGSMPCP